MHAKRQSRKTHPAAPTKGKQETCTSGQLLQGNKKIHSRQSGGLAKGQRNDRKKQTREQIGQKKPATGCRPEHEKEKKTAAIQATG
jgi:hypothetical protein